MSNETAAAARGADLGAQEAECVPWDELKPEVRERWERVADMAFSTATDLRNKLASANGKIERQAAELTKLYHLRQGDAVERMRMERELEAVKAERDELRQPVESRPVKVRFDVTEDDAWLVFRDDTSTFCPDSMRVTMDYLAAHAVIDVPKGVPSVEECSALAERSLRNAQLGGLGDGEQRYVVARDIRDAVLAGAGQTPTPATPTDAEVEALARAIKRAYMKECHVDAADCPLNAGDLAQARAAFAHIGTRQGECQECAKWKSYGAKMEGNTRVLAKRIDKARAALEGE